MRKAITIGNYMLEDRLHCTSDSPISTSSHYQIRKLRAEKIAKGKNPRNSTGISGDL